MAANSPNFSDPQSQLILQQYAKAKQNLNQQEAQGNQQLQDTLNRNQVVNGMSGGSATKLQDKALNQFHQGFAQQGTALDAQQAQDLAGVAATQQAQGFQTSERLGGQQFQTGERLGSQQYQTGILGQQEQYGTSERLGSQDFQQGILGQQQQYGTSERLGSQQFQQGVLGQQEQYGTQERLGSQQFASGERQATQQFGTAERLGSQDFQSSETAKQLDQNQKQFLSTMDLQNQQFTESKAEFSQQLGYQWNEFNENVKTNLINSAVAFQKAGLNTAPDNGYFAAVMGNIDQIRSGQYGGVATPSGGVDANGNPIPGSIEKPPVTAPPVSLPQNVPPQIINAGTAGNTYWNGLTPAQQQQVSNIYKNFGL